MKELRDEPSVTKASGGFLLAAIVGLLLGLASGAAVPCAAEVPWNVRLSTNNDLLGDDFGDDFYTFGARLDLSAGTWMVRWEENAFTDREAGFRFDETYITLGKFIRQNRASGWHLWVEGGVAWVGEGLLGQEAQNRVHELIDSAQVDLEYIEFEDTFAHGQLEFGRQWELSPSLSTGPTLSGSWTPDFRTNALAGWRTIWEPSRRFGVDLVVGGRYADSDLEVLSARLEEVAPAAIVEFKLPYTFVLEWSLNRYGTNRQHLALGVSFGPGRNLRRFGGFGSGSSAVP